MKNINEDLQDELLYKIHEKMANEEQKKFNKKVTINELQENAKIDESKDQFNLTNQEDAQKLNVNSYTMRVNFEKYQILDPNMIMYMNNLMQINIVYNGLLKLNKQNKQNPRV